MEEDSERKVSNPDMAAVTIYCIFRRWGKGRTGKLNWATAVSRAGGYRLFKLTSKSNRPGELIGL